MTPEQVSDEMIRNAWKAGGGGSVIAVDAQLRRAIAAAINASGCVLVPREPTKAMWGGLARDIVMWLDMNDGAKKTPRALFSYLASVGRPIPEWLRDEQEMQCLDAVPSKGTRAVIIYRAMLAAAETLAARGEADHE